MNKFNYYFSSLISFALLIAIMSCSTKLTRDQAESIISSNIEFPYYETRAIELHTETVSEFFHDSPDEHQVPSKKGNLLELEKEGLIDYVITRTHHWTEVRWNNPGWSDDNRYFTRERYNHDGYLTDKGKLYSGNGGVRVASIEFGTITGIVERKEDNTAEVNFTLEKNNITPFGRILFNLNEATITSTTTFTRYDDGWRMSSPMRQVSTVEKIQEQKVASSETITDEIDTKQSDNSESICEVSANVVRIEGTNVRLRSAPDISQENILLMMDKGIEIAYLGEIEVEGQKWFKVCCKNSIGWVSGQFATAIKKSLSENQEDKFSGIWDGNEATMTIAKLKTGRYKILYEDIEENSFSYTGDVEKGKLKYVDPNYDGKSVVRYITITSEKCFKDGMYEFCKK